VGWGGGYRLTEAKRRDREWGVDLKGVGEEVFFLKSRGINTGEVEAGRGRATPKKILRSGWGSVYCGGWGLTVSLWKGIEGKEGKGRRGKLLVEKDLQGKRYQEFGKGTLLC